MVLEKIHELKNKLRALNKVVLSVLKRWASFIIPLEEKFAEEDFRNRERFRDDYVLLGRSLVDHVDFETALDIGCANGFLMEPLLADGYNVEGIEASGEVVNVLPDKLKKKVTIGDFSCAEGTYDLVCCVEVAEHIPPGRTEELLEVLTKTASAYIYFTAAPPGQEGHGHINCRPHISWIADFDRRGWAVDQDATSSLRSDLEDLEQAVWLEKNSFIFVRKSPVETKPVARAGRPLSNS
jgi:hypothetical protein